eukprot:scaffold46025_cov31-Prasinocladus_malaysianus.AAC.1
MALLQTPLATRRNKAALLYAVRMSGGRQEGIVTAEDSRIGAIEDQLADLSGRKITVATIAEAVQKLA